MTKNHYWEFSNFVAFPIVGEDGLKYPTVEHYYQAHKILDVEKRKECLEMKAGEAKKWGRTLPIRKDWEDVKSIVMLSALRLRYSREPQRTILKRATVSELVEINHWHDNYWGICTCSKCKDILGQNHLGQLLRQVKKEIQDGLI